MPDDHAVEPDTSIVGDLIRLVLPADAAYGRIARIAASSLALRLGFGFGEIEDLRIAVDETIILLMRPAGAGDITIEFRIEPDALVIDATAAGTGGAGRGEAGRGVGSGGASDEAGASDDVAVGGETAARGEAASDDVAAGGETAGELDADARSRFDEIVSDTVDVAEVDPVAARVHLVKRYEPLERDERDDGDEGDEGDEGGAPDERGAAAGA